MTQEDKELLLKDISARLHYGVKFHFDGVRHIITGVYKGLDSYVEVANGRRYHIESIRPYLLPMSYIDDNEKLFAEYITTLTYDSNTHSAVPTIKTFDFYNKYHIDYRGLIPLGLAIDSTGLNIY